MESTLGLHASKTQASPLESETFRAQQAESGLQHLGRSEWWLWLSALLVTVLSATAFVLTAIPSYFRHSEHFYEFAPIRRGGESMSASFSSTAGWFAGNGGFGDGGGNYPGVTPGGKVLTGQIPESPSIDPVTGLHARVHRATAWQRDCPR